MDSKEVGSRKWANTMKYAYVFPKYVWKDGLCKIKRLWLFTEFLEKKHEVNLANKEDTDNYATHFI